MSKQIEALKQALEALEVANSCIDGYYIPKGKTHLPEVEKAITAIREALAEQPEVWVTPKLRPLARLAHKKEPLPDAEIKRIAARWFISMYWPLCNTFAREIEAAHGIKEDA